MQFLRPEPSPLASTDAESPSRKLDFIIIDCISNIVIVHINKCIGSANKASSSINKKYPV